MNSLDQSKIKLGLLHMRHLNVRDVSEILGYYFEAGGKYLDTANLYGGIEFAKVLSASLKSLDFEAKINFKFGYFENRDCYKNERSLFNYMKNYFDILGDYISSITIHEADWGIWWDSTETSVQRLILSSNVNDDRVSAINSIAAEIKSNNLSFGYSGNNAAALESISRLVNFDFLILAKQYDLLWRSGEKLVYDSINDNRAVYLAAPWHQGWLFKLDKIAIQRPEMLPYIEKLQIFLKDNNCNIYELALHYSLRALPNSGVIFGVKNMSEIEKAMITLNNEEQIQKFPEALDFIGSEFPPMGPLIAR